MKFRLSSLFYLTALVALSITSFLQWRYIDTLLAQLQAEQQRSTAMQRELVVINSQLNAVYSAQQNRPVTPKQAGN